MNILIVRLSAIGDVIHGLPVLAALRKKYPDAKLGWIVEELSSPFLRNHPLLDKLYVIPKKRWRGKFFKYYFPEIKPFLDNIRSEKWDIAIDFQGLTKSGLIAWQSGAKQRIGFAGENSREINGLFMTTKVKLPEKAVHVVEKNLSLLAALGIENPDISFSLPEDKEGDKWADNYLSSIGLKSGGFVLVNPGAGWKTKIIDPVILAEFIEKIYKEKNLKSLIIWGPKEEYLVEAIKNRLEKSGKDFWHVAPSTTLLQIMALSKKCALFAGGDTGPTHIAAAAGVPVVSFFGASDSRRNGPYSDKVKIVQHFDIDCVPCWKTECPLKDNSYLKCIRAIRSDEILSNSLLLLKDFQYPKD